jgi:hypothetical protein
MALPHEVQASIIKVAGDWALGMASVPKEPSGKVPQPSEMSDEIENNFSWAFAFLARFIQANIEDF